MKPRAPWYLLVPALAVAFAVAVPVFYLLVRGLEADTETLAPLLLRWRNAELLGNTLLLALSVVALTTVIALPCAWLVSRTDLPCPRLFTVALVAPLAIPNYIMAYVLRGIGGPGGVADRWIGWQAPLFAGFWGALLALSLHFLPYLFLNLESAFKRLDPALVESARSLGASRFRVARRVILPCLLPAFSAGALLVSLAVIGDFGVVSLMRYETFSYALYQQYDASYDRVYAAWLAVALVILAGLLLLADFWLLRGVRLESTGKLHARKTSRHRLGVWKFPAVGALLLLVGAGVVLPLATMTFWATKIDWGAWWSAPAVTGDAWWEQPQLAGSSKEWLAAVWHSTRIALPAAGCATLLALPVAFLSRRYRSRLAWSAERLAYLGYAVPCLAFGLGLIFFVLRVGDPIYKSWVYPLAKFAGAGESLYQTFPLLVFALSMHYLAEAVGPIRASLHVATPRLEEAARVLGRTAWSTFWRITFPLVRGGLVVSATLVFISAMKELPLTWLLRPIGVETLAVSAWSHADNAQFAAAAPYALAIVLLSAIFLSFLLLEARKT